RRHARRSRRRCRAPGHHRRAQANQRQPAGGRQATWRQPPNPVLQDRALWNRVVQETARVQDSAVVVRGLSWHKLYSRMHLRLGIDRVIGPAQRRVSMGRKGFSLIEMMFVFVLAGVIMAIGFPRLRNSLEKQNIRSSKALLGTLAVTARSTAVQRGCNATLNMTVDSVWVTACGVNPPAAIVAVGTKKLV